MAVPKIFGNLFEFRVDSKVFIPRENYCYIFKACDSFDFPKVLLSRTSPFDFAGCTTQTVRQNDFHFKRVRDGQRERRPNYIPLANNTRRTSVCRRRDFSTGERLRREHSSIARDEVETPSVSGRRTVEVRSGVTRRCDRARKPKSHVSAGKKTITAVQPRELVTRHRVTAAASGRVRDEHAAPRTLAAERRRPLGRNTNGSLRSRRARVRARRVSVTA